MKTGFRRSTKEIRVEIRIFFMNGLLNDITPTATIV